MSGPVVELEDVWVRYGPTVALAGVTLRIGGGLTLLLGANGSGKTTMLKVVAGLRRPSRGRVVVGGVDIYRGLAPRRPPVTGLIGDEELPYWMSAREYIEYAASIAGASVERAWELAEKLGLSEFLNRRTWALSSGTAKKLLLCIALSTPSRILLVDEPFANLDPATVSKVASLLAEESRRRPVIAATHILPPQLGGVRGAAILAAGRLLRYYDLSDPWRIEEPIYKARLSLEPAKAIEAAERLGASEVIVRGGEAYAIMNGAALKACLEEGLCIGYTLDPSRLSPQAA